MNPRKTAVLALLVLGAMAFWAFDLGRYLSLAWLQQSQGALTQRFHETPLLVAGCFFALYLAVAALSLPGAAVLTMAGGAIFGWGWGLVIVSVASTTGATLSFLAARYLLRDAVEARFGPRLADVHRGMARDGAFYLFTLRLIPLVPFFVVNLVMGLTRLKVRTFFWVSQIGMLPATAVFVNAGTQLARLESLSGILSPSLVTSLVLLGLFPLMARAVVGRLRQRRVLARWAAVRPRRFDRNLVVIGAGAGGLVAAYIAAAVKAKVTLVEARRMGGDCLNTGCVPSKTLIQSARAAHQMRHASRYGLADAPPQVSLRAVMDRVQAVVQAIAPHDSVERYTALGVEVVQGHATLTSPWTVQIAKPDGSTQTLSTRSIVIAAGAQPVVPPVPGIEHSGYVTSDTLWDRLAMLDALPARLAVLGGGPIGCELAQALQRLGSQVTLVEQDTRLLAREDDEVSDRVLQSLQADGVRVLTGHRLVRCEGNATAPVLVVEHAGVQQLLTCDLLLCAVGRSARLTGYGLEALGIATGRTVETNEYLQTLYPNIYAAGDVAGPWQFTHAAAHQAWYAAVNALFGDVKKFAVDTRVMPAATFVDPEVARVGLNEREATTQGIAHEVTRYATDDLDRQLCDAGADHPEQGFVKVLTEPGKDRILGVTIVGQHAADRLAEYVLAMKHGLGLNKMLGTPHTYPTLSEANKYAAGEWKRAHQPQRLLEWVRRYHAWRRG